MSEGKVGRHVEQRFDIDGHHYTVSTIVRDHGVTVEEVTLDDGARGYISGVVFDSEESAMESAHQLARNLIEGRRQPIQPKPIH